ncbi:MAG: type I DNA topoisomerase [Cyclobacteriaceae bacterium]|nr:type I DNA topoisomerase [Cyclobacteriaceae bacterium]
MPKNLVIVESPAKAKTIEGYLGKDFVVASSYGHVRDLPKGDNAIDIENNFTPTYEVSSDKKAVIQNLKKLAKAAPEVYLASDDDREGEAIAWHLAQALKLDEKTTQRIVFREITKTAITKAMESPRTIDLDLVDAQQARRVLDRLVGFELSPVLWKKIKYGLSAGRVQSVAVRLVVEREREIDDFKPLISFKVTAQFEINNKTFKAELPKRFKTVEEAQAFLNECNGSDFSIDNLETKPAKKTPAAPFTTSTLQQEASRKLGYSVSQTMTLAQKLYESGKITYMRTDSVNLSQDAVKAASKEISSAYGNDYVQNRTYKNKSAGAQEAHEAIRPTNFGLHSTGADRGATRLYELIWKRAIASQMADAQLEKTTAHIAISNSDHQLVSQGEMIKFEGFLKVYLESTDDDDINGEQSTMLPPLSKGDALQLNELSARESFSRHPARYTEASLVKKLEEMGIGRPSTYAPTISTIQKREYVEKEARDGHVRAYQVVELINNTVTTSTKSENTGAEKNKLFPTDIGMIVTDFLVEHFGVVLDYSFTANVEKDFDEIANGKKEWSQMMDNFYKEFHPLVESTEKLDRKDVSGDRELGKDPETGHTILVRLGKFGPMAQIGTSEELGEDEKPKFASLLKGQKLDKITLEEALKLFELPKSLGKHDDEEVIIAIGRFGPYVKFGSMYVSLDRGEDPMSVELPRAIELIEAKKAADAPIDHYNELPVQKGVGRFGPFIKWNNMFINVNKKYDFDNLTHDDIVQLIEDKKQKEIDKVIHNWEEEGIRVEKARWGRFNIIKGKTKIELAKTVDAKGLSLEDVKELIAKKAPAKKRKAPAKKKKK